jgi:hypothetical protein
VVDPLSPRIDGPRDQRAANAVSEWSLDWHAVDQRIAQAFAQPQRIGTSNPCTPHAPLLLHEVLVAAATSEDDKDELATYETWPASVLEVLEEHFRLEPWFSFYWDSFGPMSWISSLQLVKTGERRSLICLVHEEQPAVGLALAEPDDDPHLMSALFVQLLLENGDGFGVSIFGSLPRETTNWKPQLVPADVIKQAYWDWMEWAEATQGSAWVCLEEEIYSRTVEPDHLQRSRDILETLPRLDDADALPAWLEQRASESNGLPHDSRRLTLDDYFKHAYRTNA